MPNSSASVRAAT